MTQMVDLTPQFVLDFQQLQLELDATRAKIDGRDTAEARAEIEGLRQALADRERDAEEQMQRILAAQQELKEAKTRLAESLMAKEFAQQQVQAKEVALKLERDQTAAARRENAQLQVQVADLNAKLARLATVPPSQTRSTHTGNTPPTSPQPNPASEEQTKKIKSLEVDKANLQEEVKHWKAKFHDCELALLEQRRK